MVNNHDNTVKTVKDDADASVHEMREWLVAFKSCPLTAFHNIPNRVYAQLREWGLVTAYHGVTENGEAFLAGDLV